MHALRDAGPGDDAFLLQVYRSTRLDELAATGWDPPMIDAFLRQQFEVQRLGYRTRYPGSGFQIITVDEVDAGRLWVARAPGTVHLVDIALLPEHRGRGIGSAVLTGLTAEADRTGSVLSLHVDAANPARGWYEQFGFAAVGEASGPYTLMQRQPRYHDA